MANRKRSKRYREALKAFDPVQVLPVDEAIQVLSNFPKAKFDETVSVAVKLNVDPRKAEQNLRGAISLPHGTGRQTRVIAFCEGELADEAKAAGAVEAGGAELVKRIEGGWLEFDKAVAHPNQMRHVGKLGRILGPKNMMPAPKAGTVTEDIVEAVKAFSAGRLEFRTDSGGNIHVALGKRSFDQDKLKDNLLHVLDHLKTIRPSVVKGLYIERVSLSGTHTPGVNIAVEG